LPTATLALTSLSWILTTPPENRDWRTNWPAAALLAGLVLALGLTRYLGYSLPFIASRPPPIVPIAVALMLAALLAFALSRLACSASAAWIFVLLALFVVLKTPALTTLVSAWLRGLTHQSIELASAFDIRWLGFSYVAFRILHTLRDRQTGRLPVVSLAEYVTYVVFFPTLTAGPIDRLERFIQDLRRPPALSGADLGEAGKRLAIGLFKKFVIADSLALIALNGTNALQVHTAGWMWVLLYAYAFQIYLDFSGYTDIAIGIGRLMGFELPENFLAPYLKPNLTQFWNNWHMTLTQWFRAYFFNPVTRAMRAANRPIPVPIIILITQISTMTLIGLWHGVTWNFVLWGLWHGVGLFIHNRWSESTRAHAAALPPRWQSVLNFGGALLTFHFVALGWVWFALPNLGISWQVFLKLFGIV